jgi:uncharacterized membrane protein
MANLKKISLFLILLFSCLFALTVVLVAGFLFSPALPNESNWLSNTWGCMGDWMMGGTPQNTDPFWTFFGISIIVLIGLILIGIGGSVYYFMFPELQTSTPSTKKNSIKTTNESNLAYQAVTKTLTTDEQKVLEVLHKHDGKYLQKYIRKEAGLSRLKTHRILARFSERGIVTLVKKGNTNEVKLEDWLKTT